MLLLIAVCLITIGMRTVVVDSAAKPSFNMFNKNLMYGFRPSEDVTKTSLDGGGNWLKLPNYGKPEDSMNYVHGVQANNSLYGIGSVQPNGVSSPASDGQKEAGQSPEPYTMFFRSTKHTRCEECDKDGKIKGTMLVNDNGVQKMINYEALSAKNAETPAVNTNPLESLSSGAGGQSAMEDMTMPGQSYNQIAGQMMMPNSIPVQMSQHGLQQQQMGLQQQQMGLQSPTASQLSLLQQQNSIPYMISQDRNSVHNVMTPQTSSTLGSYNQLPAALGNAGQTNQQVMQRIADSLTPSNPNQIIAQRVNELMNGYSTQQWNDANRQIPAMTLANPQMSTGELTSSTSDAANMAAFKGLWQNAVPIVLMAPSSGQSMLSMANLGGVQSKDNGVGGVLSKEQATEFKSADAAGSEEVNSVMKKLVEVMERMPKAEESKETTEQTALPARR